MIIELYPKARTEGKALIFDLEDIGEETRGKAGVEGSQACIMTGHFPVEVPGREGVLEEGRRCSSSRLWEICLPIRLEVFTSK